MNYYHNNLYQYDTCNKPRFKSYVGLILFFLFISSSHVFAEVSETDKILKNGVALLLDGSSKEAKEKFSQILGMQPDHAEANFRLGQTYLQLKNLKSGLEHIKKSTVLSPKNIRYSLYLANVYERAGKVGEAANEYQRIIDVADVGTQLKKIEKKLALASGRALAKKGELNAALLVFNGLSLEYPDDPQVLFSIGSAYIALKRIEEAELVFSKLFLLDPNNKRVNMSLATIYGKENQLKRSRKHLQRIMALGGNDRIVANATEQFHVIESRIRLEEKDWKGALVSLQKIVSLNPLRGEAFFNMARVNLQLGNIQLAEQNYLSVLKIKSTAFTARLNLGQLYFDTERLDLAKEHFQYIIDNDKSGRWAEQGKIRMNMIHTIIADEALKSGNIAESLVQYEKALDFYSANTKASFTRGMIFIEQKKFKDAMLEFESVVKHTPNNLRGRLNLANVYENLEMLSKAAEQYEAIIKIDSESREAKFAAGKWKMAKGKGLWAEGKLAEAEAVFQEVTEEQPQNIEAFAFLGILQSSRGKLKEAASSYHAVLDLRPTNYPVKILLGKVFEQLGMDSLAANEYRGIIFAGGGIPQVREAKLRLAIVDSRLSGFSNTLNYRFVYDNNLNLNDEDPTAEIRSDLALSFNYALKTRDDLSLRMSWSPTYSAYHLGQRDFLRSVFKSNIIVGTPDSNWSGSISRQDQSSLVNDSRLSESTTGAVGRSLKVFAKPLFGLAPKGYEGDTVNTQLNFSGSLRHIQSLGSSPVKSVTGNLSLSMNQSLRWGVNAALNYGLVIQRNLNKTVRTRSTFVTVQGSDGLERVRTDVVVYDPRDYEYNNHSLSLSLSRAIAPGVVGSLSTSGTLAAYSNLDSGAVVRGENKKRTNLTISLSPSISYAFFKDVRFVVSGTYQKNMSSMPVALSTRRLSIDDVIASFQSTSLGRYTRYSVDAAFIMNF